MFRLFTKFYKCKVVKFGQLLRNVANTRLVTDDLSCVGVQKPLMNKTRNVFDLISCQASSRSFSLIE